MIVIIAFNYSCKANESTIQGDKMDNASFIKIKMTLQEFNGLDCKGLVAITTQDVKHKFNDNRLRKYYRYNPPISVVMKESDLKSYFEIIFEDNKLIEINQYDEKGNLIGKHNKLYCF